MANRVKGTAEKKKKFLKALGKTCNVSEAARLSGLSRRYWYKAKEKDRKFSDAWDDAVEVGVDALESEARRRAYEGYDEPVFYKGDATGVVRRYSDTLLIFLLKGARPKKYADFHRVEGGDTPIRIEIVRFSDGNNGSPAK